MGRKPKKARPQFNEGDIVTVYLDAHTDERPLAKVRLVEKVTDATPDEAFILEETSVLTQKVHSFEHWNVEILEPTELGLSFHMHPGTIFKRRIKVLLNRGITPSGVGNLKKVEGYYGDDDPSHYLYDNFEGVPGWGQQF